MFTRVIAIIITLAKNFNDCRKYGDAYYIAGEHLKHYPDIFFFLLLLRYNTSLLSQSRGPTWGESNVIRDGFISIRHYTILREGRLHN